jgi:hypothetical protein
MRIIRVFPRKTTYTPIDDLAFIGDPPLFRPPADEVHVSVTFTWDIPEGKRLQAAWSQYYPVVKLGGPAFGSDCSTFISGMYVKPGIIFTTRGCNNSCPWCLVPEREGKLIEIPDFAKGHIIQDNNLLQASHGHIENVLNMLMFQKRAAIFAGGLQSSLIDDWFASQLRFKRIDCIFLAADTPGSLSALEKALKLLWRLDRRQLRVYVMIGQDMQSDLERLQAVWDLGGLPFAQLYQPPDHYIGYSPEWRAIAREWSRPAAMFAQQAKKGNIWWILYLINLQKARPSPITKTPKPSMDGRGRLLRKASKS